MSGPDRGVGASQVLFSRLSAISKKIRPACAVPPPSSRQTRLPRGTRGTYFEILEPGVPRLYCAKRAGGEREGEREREGDGEGRKKNTARGRPVYHSKIDLSLLGISTAHPSRQLPSIALPAAKVVQARRYRHERLSRGVSTVSSLCPPCNSPLRFPRTQSELCVPRKASQRSQTTAEYRVGRWRVAPSTMYRRGTFKRLSEYRAGGPI